MRVRMTRAIKQYEMERLTTLLCSLNLVLIVHLHFFGEMFLDDLEYFSGRKSYAV